MLALSVWEPFGLAMAQLGKDVENRDWRTHHRGEFLIHVTQSVKRANYEMGVKTIRHISGASVAALVPPYEKRRKGGIVGLACLVDVISPCLGACSRPWHFHDSYGFLLEGMRPLPFVACSATRRGGFWNVPPEVLRALHEATGDKRFAREAA